MREALWCVINQKRGKKVVHYCVDRPRCAAVVAAAAEDRRSMHPHGRGATEEKWARARGGGKKGAETTVVAIVGGVV